MPSVRDATYEILRAHGMTTVFGNPGSTELPFLADFPDDFDYVLGLQEAVVVAMADGFAQANGRPALVNLHTAPGVGHAMGALFNAGANKAPLVVTAGQQVRAMMTMEALLTNRDADLLPRPAVKWSHEPPRAENVPAAVSRAALLCQAPPRGPVFLSLPMDDWAREADEGEARVLAERTIAPRAGPDPGELDGLAERLAAAVSPALVIGPDVDASGGWDEAVELAERLRVPVWASPASGAGRIGFPESHPAFQGILPPAIAPLSEALQGRDLVLVVGAPVFTYYPYIPGPLLPEGAQLVFVTSDPDEAARAPMGEALLGDPALALRGLLERMAERPGDEPSRRPPPADPPEGTPLPAAAALAALASVFPEDGIVVNESPSNLVACRDQVRLSRPGSWFFAAGGGLGFGLPAAVGVQMARPDRPVIAVIGEGSAHYAITALWTAVQRSVPVTFLVLRNDEYAILKFFGDLEGEKGVPGLDVPDLDTAAVARGYGMDARRAEGADELRTALEEAIATEEPRLVEVPIQPGMSLG